MNISSKDIPGLICEGGRLKTMLLVPNNATASVDEISQALCSLDEKTIIEMSEYLTEQISIGNFIQEVTPVNISW